MDETAALTPTVASGRGLSGVLKVCASLCLMVFLCLPSLIGGAALLLQLTLHTEISEWNATASALIALGALSAPLVALAAVLGTFVAFSRLPRRLKFAHAAVFGAAVLATIFMMITMRR